MKLASFITSHREEILEECEMDARQRVITDHGLTIAQLRDHLGELLSTVAHDLDAAAHRSKASAGSEVNSGKRVDAVAERHGARRAQQGLTVNQVVSEFPILRSHVSRSWLQSRPKPTPSDLKGLILFDEAIDRALAQSVAEFTGLLDQSRGTFLGIIGHDLRDPLGTIITGGKLLLEDTFDETTTRDIVRRMVSTGERMHALVVDLLDAMRTRLGGRMPIERRRADLAENARNIVDEFSTSHPERTFNFRATEIRGGSGTTSVWVRPSEIWTPRDPTRREAEHFGLGLYVANSIVVGHGGHIEVDSSPERGTTFTIHLPRAQTPPR